MKYDKSFWDRMTILIDECDLIIDRKKGTAHPRYPDFVYPVGYGYLNGTSSMDGNGIDVWLGSNDEKDINGIICTIDLTKKDSEIKILIGCTEDEIKKIYDLHNQSENMKGLLITNEL